ncbi:Pentatricopeptide repeat-containing protein At2g27610 [Linum perenne]
MLDCGITPNKYTFPFVLKACSALQAVEEGRAIHAHAKRVHLDSDVYVSTALVDTYLKCGSWIEIDGTIHAFVGGDRSHPLSQQINKKLDELQVEMKKLGYTAESSYVFQDVEEEEKDTILLYHSEKLAIAFGILSLSPSKPILVTKNLRVCGDCHSAIKLISLITKRDITVRDASRFHHFKDGNCNCGDFW